MKLPSEATAGLTFQAAVAFAAYPAPSWGMTLHLRGPGQIDLVGTQDGTSGGFIFSATATETADWQAGEYWFTLRAAKGADVFEAGKGQMVIRPDLAAVTAAYDGKTDNEKALEAIDAVLGKRATIDQERYTINNRELWRTPIADLLKLRAYYKTQVRKERQRASGCSTFGRPIHVRFK